MKTPYVLVLPCREVRGWNGQEAELGNLLPCEPLPLIDALERTWTTDAHFWPGEVIDAYGNLVEPLPRINQRALSAIREAGDEVFHGALVVDIDDPDAHAQSRPATDQWADATLERLLRLPWSNTMAWYRTRGGYRALWTLDPMLEVEAFVALGAAFRAELRRLGLPVDELRDWTRLYRLPFVVRDGSPQRLAHDFSRLGPLDFEPPRRSTKPSGAPSPLVTRSSTTFSGADIEVGSRNSALTSYAGSLAKAGRTLAEIEAAVRRFNENRCVPPLPADEVEAILRSAERWREEAERKLGRAPVPESAGSPAAPDPFYACLPVMPGRPGQAIVRVESSNSTREPVTFDVVSERAIAEQMLRDLEVDGTSLRADERSIWRYVSARGVWAALDRAHLSALLFSYDGAPIVAGARGKCFAAKNTTASQVYDVILAVRRSACMSDTPPKGLCVENGFATTENGQLVIRPHSPEHLARHHTPLRVEPGARPTQFLAFLDACFANAPDSGATIQCLREFVGACLLGIATTFQRAMILLGPGANGKSTFLKIVNRLFPATAVAAVPPQDFDNEYRLATLATARLNVCNEMPEAEVLVSAPVKAFISGDLMTGRAIYDKPFSFTPAAGVLCAANTLPVVRDTSTGFFRRWIIVPWEERFEGSHADPRLADRIIATELGAIISWALEGAAQVEARGDYVPPPSSQALVAEWRTASNSVAQWLDDACDPPSASDADYFTAKKVLYLHYQMWASRNGCHAVRSSEFAARLKALNVPSHRTAEHRGFRLRLRPDFPVSPETLTRSLWEEVSRRK
jgi:P4 family phage/plasmid primase-like protien